MRTLALATGLLLLAIATASGPGPGPRLPDSRLWLALLESGPKLAGESVLASPDRPRPATVELAGKP